jgi:metal-responsive CopG/Arc/MetJ family transcriptional regulator
MATSNKSEKNKIDRNFTNTITISVPKYMLQAIDKIIKDKKNRTRYFIDLARADLLEKGLIDV